MAKTANVPGDEAELTQDELDDLTIDLPVSQRRLITSSADFSVDTLVSMLREASLVVPSFQRKYIWSERKASRLVESLILQCPIPVVYLNRREDEILEVVDGNQRVTSLRRFIDGHFSLSGLTAYPELIGSDFDALDGKQKRQIKNRTIRCVIIEPESNPKIKFDVFERLNSGSTPLSPQELRHGLYFGPFVAALGKMAANAKFVAMAGLKNDQRMKGDELVLRFFSLSENLAAYEKPLSSFLSNYLNKNCRESAEVIESKQAKFNKLVADIHDLLGANAFRMRSGEGAVRKFNAAYFDAISVGFASSSLFGWDDYGAVDKDQLRNAVEQVADSDNFKASTLRATSDKASIEKRIGLMRAAFDLFA